LPPENAGEQAKPITPDESATPKPPSGSDESQPRAQPDSKDGSGAEGAQKPSTPSDQSPWPKNHNEDDDNAAEPPSEPLNSPDNADGAQKPPAPSEPFSLPEKQPKGRSVPFHTGQDIVDNIRLALDNDWHDYLQGIGRVVDATHWLKDQATNIVSAVDFYQGGPPYDLQDLNDAAKKDSEPGSHDHHIVEQGPQNEDLSPEDKKLIDDPKNQVRLPVYVHQQITNYYWTPNAELGGLTPRQYFRQQKFTFAERYQFGLDVLRKRGIIK
jgi:hypothetical protein